MNIKGVQVMVAGFERQQALELSQNFKIIA